MKIGVEHDDGIREHIDRVFGLDFRFVVSEGCSGKKEQGLSHLAAKQNKWKQKSR
jgi:hypothetical protein